MPLSLGIGTGLHHGGAQPPWLWSADFTGLTPGAVSLAPFGLSFARASTATTQTGASTVVTGLANDAPRAGSDGTHAGLLLEETRTNLVALAHAVTGTGWNAGTNVTLTAGFASPDGTANATREQVTSGGWGQIWGQALAAGTYSLSSWQMRGAAGGLYQFFPNVGGATVASALGGTAPASWTRYAATLTQAASGGVQLMLVDGRDHTAFGGIVAGARDVLTDLSQVEVGGFATEVIATAGASAARAGERLYDAAGSRGVDAGRLSLALACVPKGARSAYGAAARLWTSGSDFAELAPATGVLTVSIGGATNTTSAITWSALDTLELFVAAGGGAASKVSYRLNGGATTACTVTGSALGTLAVGGALDLLCSGTANQLTAWVRSLTAYRSGQAPAWVI